MKSSKTLLAILALLGSCAAFAGWQYQASAAALRVVVSDTERCSRLATDIKSLRELPQFAVLQAESAETTAEVIQQAAEESRLPGVGGRSGRALARVQPRGSYRLGDSQYEIRPYQIDLVDVTLAQVITFAHRLADGERGLTVRDLRLRDASSASSQATSELWNAQMTLTQVVFSPISRPNVSR